MGKETILMCNVASSPIANVYWTREGSDVPLHTNKYTTTIYNDGLHEFSLSLNIINLEARDFGEYTCHASNSLGRDSSSVVLYGMVL